jgi:hypothetical protein
MTRRVSAPWSTRFSCWDGVDLLLALPFETPEALALREEIQRASTNAEPVNEAKP